MGTLPDGTYYEGEYFNGLWHGYGILVNPDGSRYEGEFRRGKYEGHGKLSYIDGGFYDGEFLAGKRHGQGTYNVPVHMWNRSDLSEMYRGAWENDYMHGEGIYEVEQPEGWTKIRDGVWILGTLRDWTRTHYNEAATERFCESFAAWGGMAAHAAAQQSSLDYQRYGFFTESYKCKGAYSMFVAENLPFLPPGVDPSDRRVRVIVRDIIKGWSHGYDL